MGLASGAGAARGGAPVLVVVGLLADPQLLGADADLAERVAAQITDKLPEGAQVAFVSSGSAAEQAFSRACISDRVSSWSLLPFAGRSSGGGGLGGGGGGGDGSCYNGGALQQVLRAGRNATERRKVWHLLADVFICIHGGAVAAAEARQAFRRGAALVPLSRTGGACNGNFDFPTEVLQRPERVSSEQWALLGDERTSASAAAGVAASLVAARAEALEEAEVRPETEVLTVSSSSLPEFNGLYVRTGLRQGRKRYVHIEHPELSCVFSEGCWNLCREDCKVFQHGSSEASPPSREWELLPRPAPLSKRDGDGGSSVDKRRMLSRANSMKRGAKETGKRGGSISPPKPINVEMPELQTAPEAPKAPSSLSVTAGSRLAELIQQGCIAVVKSSYLEDCVYNKRAVCVRQKVPSMQMWSGAEAVKLWQKHGKCFMVVVSHPWLSKTHPDPDNFHLKALVGILSEYRRLWNMSEIAVFFDYCSLWQRGDKSRDVRTEDQKVQFEEAMGELATLYAHKAVTTVQLLAVPAGEPRAYEHRGWTLLESVMIGSKSGDWNRWAIAGFDVHSAAEDPYVLFDGMRRIRLWPPLSAKRFQAELKARGRAAEERGAALFADPADNELVPQRYQEGLRLLCRKTILSYCDALWGDDEVELLCEVLPDCSALEKLSLTGNSIGASGAASLVKVLPTLTALKVLDLKGNPMCLDGESMDKLRLVWQLNEKPASGLLV